MANPKYNIITFGCQMNKSDSERIETLLNNFGFEKTDNKMNADLIIINTCSVRQSAEDRVFGLAREFSKLKIKNPKMIIAVTGCMAGRDRNAVLRDKLPIVDLFFPIDQMTHLPKWIGELRPELANSDNIERDYLKLMPNYNSRFQAYVAIQTGCNNFCTYCVVPFARGLEKNRPLKDILDEINRLAQNGCVEVTLLGQTVNSYKAPDPENFSKANPYNQNFARLLWEINQVHGIKRLHFTAPHPIYMSDEVIDAMTLPAHVNFLHIPVQSGDDEILRKMNRRYTSGQFIDMIDRVKSRIPNIAIGTDIIVGFCGESEEQFQRTVDLYKYVQFDISYHAMYSPRSGTAAFRVFKDDVPRREKRRRWLVLQDLMEKIVLEKNEKFVGQTVSVLVDRFLEPSTVRGGVEISNMCLGNSREMKMVRFQGSKDLIGQIVDVKINQAKEWVLIGQKL